MPDYPRDYPHPRLPAVPDPHHPGRLVHLTPHAGSGQWRKRHLGRDHYFGPLADPEAAVAAYIARWPAIVSGRPSPPPSPAITLVAAFTARLEHCRDEADDGARSAFTVAADHQLAREITRHFGGRRPLASITPAEWSLAERALWGGYTPVTREVRRQRLRAALAWIAANMGVDANLGTALRPVPTRTRRRHARLRGEQLLTPGQIRRLIKACRAADARGHRSHASRTTEAALWLASNGGMRQADIASLTPSALTVRGGVAWLDEPRPKTESPRRFALWPETRAAIDAARGPSASLLLSTESGSPLVRPGADLLERRLRRLVARCWGEESRWSAVTWSRFRTTFITVAKSARLSDPQYAGDVQRVIAGHALRDVHEAYVQRLPDRPFTETADHVRRWLGLA